MTTKNILINLMVFLALAACSALPGNRSADSPFFDGGVPVESDPGGNRKETGKSTPLAASILAVVWKDNSQGHFLVPLNPSSGEVLTQYEPISLGHAFSHAFSPDGQTLAAVGFVSSEYPRGGSLHLIDLATWEDRVFELRLDAYVNAMEFSPDGKQLAIAYGSHTSTLFMFDTRQAAVRIETSLDFLVYRLGFTSDGSSLMLYGSRIENRFTASEMSPNPPVAVLTSTTDLGLEWETDLAGVRHGVVPKEGKDAETTDLHQPGQALYLFPGLAFAPDRDALYVIHPDEDRLTTVDFNAQKVSTLEIRPELSWIERLLSLTAGTAHAKIAEGTEKRMVVSPDGQFLYIVGQRSDLLQDRNNEWQVLFNPLGLQIVRTVNGSLLESYDTEASELDLSPDGRYLYLRGWDPAQDSHWTQVFDTASRQFIQRLDDTWLVPTRRVDGTPIMASSVWIENEGIHKNAFVETLDVQVEWHTDDYLSWLIAP